MQLLLYLVFILSGAAGLMYESIWSRYLGLFVGHSAYAQIIVLTIFLGGMSLGAFLAGQRSERLREPLYWYAAIEFVVGLIGIIFHDVFVGVTSAAYASIFPSLAGSPFLVIAKWGIASLLILPQSILLGATFPLMSAGVLRIERDRPGRVLALLYFANSLGAAIGVLIAGFYLIKTSGLPGTLLAAAIINMIVALATFTGNRLYQMRGQARAATPSEGAAPALPSEPAVAPPRAADAPEIPLPRLWRLLLLLSFGTAVASFIYEIAWIRMLSLVLGSATHSFELMLSAFILGLALGSLWAHRSADRLRDPVRTLGLVQWLMGFAALATLPLYLKSFDWTTTLLAALDHTPPGYNAYTFARYAFCLVVMLPATFCAGITLPLITRTLLVAGAGERAVGWVYSVNTLGSIVGVILAGLVLLPWLGLKLLLVEGAIIDMALGVLLLRLSAGQSVSRRRDAYVAGAAIAVVVLVVITRTNFDRNTLSSGVYRYGRVSGPTERQVEFYKDGRTATVTVGRGGSVLYIATNGKPDGSLDSTWFATGAAAMRRGMSGDVSTQVLLPLVTLAHAPAAKRAAVIGQGTGMSSHFLLGSPHLERLYTIEIEPQMIRGSRSFYPANRRVFDDPRGRFVVDDAKSFFAAAGEKFDLILSEPSNPWVSGVSWLFTTEFYARVKRYLTPDGVFGQWLHLYEISDGLVLSVLAAIHHNFPSYEIFLTGGTDILIVASNRETLPSADWSVFDFPMVKADLNLARPLTAAQLEATRLLSRAALEPALDSYRLPNSDFFPVLDLGAEATRYLGQSATGFIFLSSGRFDIVAPFTGRRLDFSAETHTPFFGNLRARSLAVGAAVRRPGAVRPESVYAELKITPPLHRRWRFDALLASPNPPADWRLWLQDMLDVEQDIHGGTAGVADEAFYGAVARFLDRHRAPQEVRDAVSFIHGLAAWDFPEASRAADGLLQSTVDGKSWLPVDAMRDGAVVAKIRAGDPAGARRYLKALAPQITMSPDDFRARLLYSYLLAAERTARTERRDELSLREGAGRH